MIDLKKLQEKFDKYFEEETVESFENWMKTKNIKQDYNDLSFILMSPFNKDLLIGVSQAFLNQSFLYESNLVTSYSEDSPAYNMAA
jgi:hypothetical protein